MADGDPDTSRPTVRPPKHDGLAPAGVGGNGLAQHTKRVERRAPGDDLGDAQREDSKGCRMAGKARPSAGWALGLPFLHSASSAPRIVASALWHSSAQ